MEIRYLVHLLAYCILPEGATIILFKIDGLFNIMGNLNSILVLDIVSLIMGIRGLGHNNELLGVLCESPCPFPRGCVKEIIIP